MITGYEKEMFEKVFALNNIYKLQNNSVILQEEYSTEDISVLLEDSESLSDVKKFLIENDSLYKKLLNNEKTQKKANFEEIADRISNIVLEENSTVNERLLSLKDIFINIDGYIDDENLYFIEEVIDDIKMDCMELLESDTPIKIMLDSNIKHNNTISEVYRNKFYPTLLSIKYSETLKSNNKLSIKSICMEDIRVFKEIFDDDIIILKNYKDEDFILGEEYSFNEDLLDIKSTQLIEEYFGED